jgi:hypothetical protein
MSHKTEFFITTVVRAAKSNKYDNDHKMWKVPWHLCYYAAAQIEVKNFKPSATGKTDTWELQGIVPVNIKQLRMQV